MLLLLACVLIDEESITLVRPSEMVTAAAVEWRTERPALGTVDYGPTAAYGFTTPLPAEESTEHYVPLLGLTPDSVWHYRVVARTGNRVEEGEDHTLPVPALPDEVPTFLVDEPLADPDFGPWFLTTTVSGEADDQTVMVFDAEGTPVWYLRPDEGFIPAARLSHDGTAVLYVLHNGEDLGAGRVVSAPLDGTEPTTFLLPGAHHDLVPMEDGGFAVIVTELREIDGESIAGDALVEVDADGNQTEIWNAFESLPIIENQGWVASSVEGARDWTHGDGLAWDEEEGCYYLSMYWPRQVVKVRRSDGATLWVLGGQEGDPGDFTFAPGAAFGPQHSPEVFPGGLRLFDNASGGARLVEYTLDEDAGTATLDWSWSPPEPIISPVLGDVHRTDAGATLSAWGSSGEIYALDAAGTVTWHALISRPTAIGQLSSIPRLYPR